jgi:Domain of unknown function (DUF4249)
MPKIVLRFLLLVLVIGFVSCEKEIDLQLETGENKIVVEGVIETNQVPYVTLTKSIGFFSKIDLSKIGYIKGAIIQVKDLTDNQFIQLKEYDIDTTIDGNQFSFVVYGPDILDANALNFKGKVQHAYQLSIDYAGKKYESVTTIPAATLLDSLWMEPVKGKEDSFSMFKVMYDDPDSLGNCVRIETKRNRYKKTSEPELFYTADLSVYDDVIANGLRFPVSIEIGYDKSRDLKPKDYQDLYYARKGDTITLKWSAIDRQTFRFWETLAFSKGSVGNPFASPTKVQGNIAGALGIWGGYSAVYYTIIDSIK